MALTWPPPAPSNVYSLRFYQAGTATASFADRRWNFTHPADSNKQAWSNGIIVRNTGGVTLEVSFDGTNVHISVPAGQTWHYFNRIEGGIAVRGNTGTFVLEAW